MFWSRRRGTDRDVTATVPPYRRIMPYLFSGRNESAVYSEFTLDLSEALLLLDELNRNCPHEERITIFHLFLRATALAITRCPRVNRYIAGRRFYERKGVTISFTAKKSFDDDAPLIVIKLPFPVEETLETMVERVQTRLNLDRSGRKSYTDRELQMVLAFPRCFINFFIRVVRWADYFNMLPEAFRRNDPMFASIFVANLGSLGLEAAWHHLYEYGSIPFFVTLGKVTEHLRVRDGVPTVFTGMLVRVTVDERIEDGYYINKALDLVIDYFKEPRRLMGPLSDQFGDMANRGC